MNPHITAMHGTIVFLKQIRDFACRIGPDQTVSSRADCPREDFSIEKTRADLPAAAPRQGIRQTSFSNQVGQVNSWMNSQNLQKTDSNRATRYIITE